MKNEVFLFYIIGYSEEEEVSSMISLIIFLRLLCEYHLVSKNEWVN